jgi:uncharacterized protein (DUF849 family)
VPSKQRVKVPITPEEQVDSICRSFEAGARMVHVHVRDEAGKPSYVAVAHFYAEVNLLREYLRDLS